MSSPSLYADLVRVAAYQEAEVVAIEFALAVFGDDVQLVASIALPEPMALRLADAIHEQIDRKRHILAGEPDDGATSAEGATG